MYVLCSVFFDTAAPWQPTSQDGIPLSISLFSGTELGGYLAVILWNYATKEEV